MIQKFFFNQKIDIYSGYNESIGFAKVETFYQQSGIFQRLQTLLGQGHARHAGGIGGHEEDDDGGLQLHLGLGSGVFENS